MTDAADDPRLIPVSIRVCCWPMTRQMVRRRLPDDLESDPEIEVVGEAANGEQATASTRRLRLTSC